MAIYNLARGGFAPEFSNAKGSCGCGTPDCALDELGLPIFLQPDLRSDGGYGFRDKVEWKQLMRKLEVRYGKSVDDLQVGDKLYIFLQPNHSNVKSLFVDFREPVAGFKFTLSSARNGEFAPNSTNHVSTYSENKAIESTENKGTTAPDTDSVEQRTQWNALVNDGSGYSAKVDAVVLEIVALPSSGSLNEMQALFARRFEQDGYMM